MTQESDELRRCACGAAAIFLVVDNPVCREHLATAVEVAATVALRDAWKREPRVPVSLVMI